MKSLIHLTAMEILFECGSLCGVDTTRDGKTITNRFEAEGVSFLTITLPSFCKDFERSLDVGRIADASFLSFKRGRGGLPLFLGGFLRLIFDHTSGRLLENPSEDAIFFVRQITMAFGKIFALPSNKRQQEALRKYLETDQEVNTHEYKLHAMAHLSRGARPRSEADPTRVFDPGEGRGVSSPCPTSRALLGAEHQGLRARGQDQEERVLLQSMLLIQEQVVLQLYSGVLRALDTSSREDGVGGYGIPRHGPGSTSEGLLGNAKYAHHVWPRRLDDSFPHVVWGIPNQGFWRESEPDRVTFLSLAQERPAKVLLVPKTMKTPRIIAKEPTALQYVQQSMMRDFVPALENDSLVGPMIGFSDQEPNRLMACEGSRNGTLATLDLSEASDRVSLLHVRLLLRRYPSLLKRVLACRSRKADVPGYGVVHLAKFASMGSALTFPLEAMVFLSIVVSAVLSKRSLPVTMENVRSLHGAVRVYGDDIVVPVDCAETVSEWLEAFGLKVNYSKSFWTGKFRESCGGDFYNGQNVTPARMRKEFPRKRSQTEEVAALVSFRNQLYELGFWRSAAWLDKRIRSLLIHFPIVEPTSSILGRTSFSFPPEAGGWDADLHHPVVKGYVIRSVIGENPLDGWPALMKWFLHCEGSPESEPMQEDHLIRSGRAKKTRLVASWRRPY